MRLIPFESHDRAERKREDEWCRTVWFPVHWRIDGHVRSRSASFIRFHRDPVTNRCQTRWDGASLEIKPAQRCHRHTCLLRDPSLLRTSLKARTRYRAILRDNTSVTERSKNNLASLKIKLVHETLRWTIDRIDARCKVSQASSLLHLTSN